MNKDSVLFCNKKFNSLFVSAMIVSSSGSLITILNNIIANFFVGPYGVSSIGMLSTFYSILYFLFTLILFGTQKLYVDAIGRMDQKSANKYFTQGLILNIGLAIILSVSYFCILEHYYAYMGITGELLLYTRAYGKLVPLIMFVLPIQMYISSMIYTDGDTKLSNLSVTVQIILNITLSAILSRFLGMFGINLASLISAIVVLLICCTHFFKKINTLKFDFYINLKEIFSAVRLGLPPAVVDLSNAIVAFVMNKLIIVNFGEDYLVVFSLVLSMITYTTWFKGFSQCLQPLYSAYEGDNNTKMMNHTLKNGYKVILIFSFCLTLLFSILTGPYVTLFISSNPELHAEAVKAVHIVCLFFPFMSTIYFFCAYFVFRNKVALASICTLLNMCIMIISLCSCLIMPFGIKGIYFGYLFSPIITMIFMFLYLYIRYGKSGFPFYISHDRDDNIYMFSMALNENNIMSVVNNIQNMFKDKIKDASILNKLELFVEEISMVIFNKNDKHATTIEYTVDLNDDGVKLVIRDDGKIFDITDSDVNIDSFRTYIVSNIMENQESKAYLTTTGYNKNVFKFA